MLSLAREQGLLDDPSPDSHDHENVVVPKAALDEMDRQVAAHKGGLPDAGGGRWANALRDLIRGLEELSRTTRGKLK